MAGEEFQGSMSARRTESVDAPHIIALINDETEKLFGRVNIIHVIEKSSLSVTIVDNRNTVIGFAAFFDQPNVITDGSHWVNWLRTNYDAPYCNHMNSLFLRLFVCQQKHNQSILKEIARTVFHSVPLLHNIVLMVPIETPSNHILERVFLPYKPTDEQNASFKAMVCHRHDHCPVLHIRIARIEDHDDLMPILEKHDTHLTQVYGEYFLADLIEGQDNENKCFAAEVDSTAVGLLSVTSHVDLTMLSQNFELEIFDGFTKNIKQKSDGIADESKREEVTKNKVLNEENVFCIQLMCIDGKYESRSIDFLVKIFKMYPEKEYLFIMVPHMVQEFPLLHSFTRVAPKNTSVISQELYLYNRNALHRAITIRACISKDVERINDLTEQIHGCKQLMRDVAQYKDYNKDANGARLYIYVAEVNSQVVGVCVLRQEQEIDYLRSCYNIEDFVYFQLHEHTEHARLHHFLLNPIFQHLSKYFIKEVLHLSKKTCLYYPIFKETVDVLDYSLLTCVKEFVPVGVRRQIVYPTNNENGNMPLEKHSSEKDIFALYHFNTKLTYEPKVVVNARIVLVGSSNVGLSMLHSLMLSPHLCFNNVTLVSNSNVFDANEELMSTFLPRRDDCLTDSREILALRVWVNFVHGKMTKIDRDKQIVYIDGSRMLPYDQLVLCTGEVFSPARPTGVDVKKLLTTDEALQHQNICTSIPANMCAMNSYEDCLQVKEWTASSFDYECAVVYGCTLEAYTCVHGLLKLGVQATTIHHVMPPSIAPIFQNEEINDILCKILEDLGIKSYSGYTLAQYMVDENNKLNAASFTSDSKPLILPCTIFISCHEKNVDYDSFKAINDSCLVFDGRLVINSNFLTNDPNIYAGGSLTKYARRYCCETSTNTHRNSKQVGQQLAGRLLQLFDPTYGMVERDQHVIPKCTQPKSVICSLPGDLTYFRIWKSSSQSHVLPLNSEGGENLVTGATSLDQSNGFFKLHINKQKFIDEIVCLSKKNIETSNFLRLHGFHERYLNNLVQRFKANLIPDLYEYFRETWCMAIYHDRFVDFRSEIRDLFANSKDLNVPSLEEKTKRLVQEGLSTRDDHIKDAFVGEGLQRDIQERLICYLDYNQYHLPMYARPGMM